MTNQKPIQPSPATVRMLRLPEVETKVGLKSTSIYRLANTPAREGGGFPRPVKLGRASVWLEHEVDAWLMQRADARASVGAV